MSQSLKNICRLLDNAKVDVAPERSFLGDLKRSIEMTALKEDRAPSKTYKPSSMNCIRNMYYQVTGHPQDEGYTPYTLVCICNSGSDTHERIQYYVSKMRENGIDCDYVDVADYIKEHNLDYLEVVGKQGNETKIRHKTLNMSLLCDGIIKYKGQYYILEIKTESQYKWQRRGGVDPKHYKQGTAYSLVFGINKVVFLYISRDVLDMKTYMYRPTREAKDELVEQINECDNYVAEGKLPPKPADVPRTVCEYCSYRLSCREAGG